MVSHRKTMNQLPTTNETGNLLPGEVPAVNYADASSLDRPTSHGAKHVPFIVACACAAVVISGLVGYKAYDAIVIEPEAELQRTIDTLNAEASYNLPLLLNLISLTDAEMEASLRAADNTLVFLKTYPEDPEESEGFDVYRLADGISERVGGTYLDNGISQLKSSQAASLLNGSWRYTVYRYLVCSVRLQYADFNATTAYDAIASAMESQGWLTSEVALLLASNFAATEDMTDVSTEETEAEVLTAAEGESDASGEEVADEPSLPFSDIQVYLGDYGEDDNGNTFQAGSIVLGEDHYEFRISTVTVEDMYGLGLPKDGMFVGIRLTQVVME